MISSSSYDERLLLVALKNTKKTRKCTKLTENNFWFGNLTVCIKLTLHEDYFIKYFLVTRQQLE